MKELGGRACPKGPDRGCGAWHRGCIAHNRAGGPCGAQPMIGTDPPRCRSHLGRKAEVVRAEYAVARQAQAAYKLADKEIGDGLGDPLRELLRLSREVLTWKEICRDMVGGLQEVRYKSAGSGEQLRAEIALYERSMERAARLLADLVRLGIEERVARIDERQGAVVADVIKAILADLTLSVEQQARVPEVVPRRMRELRVVEAVGD
jgi:hypothetical protein